MVQASKQATSRRQDQHRLVVLAKRPARFQLLLGTSDGTFDLAESYTVGNTPLCLTDVNDHTLRIDVGDA